MTKFIKLKTFNILVFALVPLLVIAMVATITLAAMTAGKEAGTEILISKIGTISCAVDTKNSDQIYPGATCTVTLKLTYSSAGTTEDVSSITIAPSSLSWAKITQNGADGKALGTLYSGSDSQTFLTNVSLNKGDNIVIAKGATVSVPLTFKIKRGTGDSSKSAIHKDNYLLYSAKTLTLGFKLTAEPTA